MDPKAMRDCTVVALITATWEHPFARTFIERGG
jgi:hypothetical protein